MGTRKIAVMLLAGLALTSGGCLPDNFWADRGAALAASILELIVRTVTGGNLSVL